MAREPGTPYHRTGLPRPMSFSSHTGKNTERQGVNSFDSPVLGMSRGGTVPETNPVEGTTEQHRSRHKGPHDPLTDPSG